MRWQEVSALEDTLGSVRLPGCQSNLTSDAVDWGFSQV